MGNVIWPRQANLLSSQPSRCWVSDSSSHHTSCVTQHYIIGQLTLFVILFFCSAAQRQYQSFRDSCWSLFFLLPMRIWFVSFFLLGKSTAQQWDSRNFSAATWQCTPSLSIVFNTTAAACGTEIPWQLSQTQPTISVRLTRCYYYTPDDDQRRKANVL